VASGFSNVEFDIERGERGSGYVHCAALLRELTGAEDALVGQQLRSGTRALVEHRRRTAAMRSCRAAS
jgi:seryl-tRNA(Sec) selenium transferase